MTAKTDLTFRTGENWRILFVAHEEDGSIMSLDGASVLFRLMGLFDDTFAIEKTTGDGILITDGAAGAARIDVSVDDQTAAVVTPEEAYTYEIKVIRGDDSSIQAEGRLIVEASLFGPAVSLLLRVFRFRFPEIAEDDATVMAYLREAQLTIAQDIGWNILDVESGTIYLAAHNMMMRKNASHQYESGGAESTGAVRTISIEDRTVSFGDSSSNRAASGGGGSNRGFSETVYGRQFQLLSRRQVRFSLRA